MKKKRRKILKIISLILIIFIILVVLVYMKIIILNHPSNEKYEVSGIDVSHYQGQIDWKVMETKNIDFAFIKATEGSQTVDEYFNDNWRNARKTTIPIGAYHFFSFESSAETQANNYISTVGSLNGSLPPVIDFEFYGTYENNPPNIDKTRAELHNMLNILEKYYGKKPIIYATRKTYKMYIKDEFEGYPLWIRNVYYSPDLDMNNKWVFWQYTDRAVMDGYYGDEKYIDMNVFNGTKEEFEKRFID